MAPSLVDSMRRIVDEDDSNNNRDESAAADILRCPKLIQEKYNRLHMIQHETRRTTARQSIRRPPSASSWRKQQQQQQQQQQQPQQQNDESKTTAKGSLNLPTKMLPLPSRVTRTSFDNRNNANNTMMFGMLDQMLLDDHDDDDSSSSYTAASSFSGGSSDDDDDYSCSSVASYNSLIFGDDGISSNITPSSFSSVNRKQNPNKDIDNDHDEEGDDTEYDDSETAISSDGEEEDDDEEEEEEEEGAEGSSCCGSSINSDVTVEDFLTVTSGGLGGRGRSKHDHQPYHSSDDDDVLCPLAQQLLIKVPNNQKFAPHPSDSPLSSPTPSSLKSSSQYHNQNTKHTMNKMKVALKSKNKKSVTWNNKASCKLIRHLNDYTNEEISKLFVTSKEASKIRDGCYQVIQILEKEEDVLMEIQRTIQNGSGPDDATLDVATTFHKTLLDSIRGLERHTSENNEKLHAKREQMYASVFKIQSLNLPPGLMDIPGTIADVCTKLAEPSVQKAIELAAKDELEAQRVYYGDAIAPSSSSPSSLPSPSPSPQNHHHHHRRPKVTSAGRRQPHVVGRGVMD